MTLTPVRSMHRPEGTISRTSGASALVSVALAALAVGLGLAKRSWPIGAGLGGASLLVASLGCSHARRSVAASPRVLIINATHISVVQGRISEQRDVEAIIFDATSRTQFGWMQGVAGPAPIEENGRAPVVDHALGGSVATGAGNLVRHGVERLVHVVGPRAGDDQRLQEVYVGALTQAHQNRWPRIAISLTLREGGHALADNARIALAAIRAYASGRNQVTQIRLVAENGEQMQAITAAIEAQRNQVGQA